MKACFHACVALSHMYSTDIAHGRTNISVSLVDLVSLGKHTLIHASVAKA